MLRHSGSTFGYRALLTLLPKCNFGVFLALTGDDPNYLFRTNVHLYIHDLLLGYEPWLNATTLCSFPEPWHRKDIVNKSADVSKNHTAHRNLTDYVGVYSNNAYGTLSISVNETSNTLMMKYGYGKFVMYPKSEKDEFFAEGAEMLENIRSFSSLQFGVDKDDTVIATLTVPSFETKMPPIFDKRVPGVNQSNTGCLTSSSVLLAFLLFVATNMYWKVYEY